MGRSATGAAGLWNAASMRSLGVALYRAAQPPHTGNTWPTKQFAASLHR